MNEFVLEELESATENFSVTKVIGKGSHGVVYKGILNGQSVAIKKQSLGLQKLKDNSKLENEAQILSSLRRNSCFIDLLGISHDSFNNKIIVTKFMSNGTLHDALHLSTKFLTWPKRVEIALQVARAVRFLHESKPSIVHRDIKSSNILFDANWNAKLADFGLAIRLNSDQELNLPAGTIGYLDPDYTTPSKLSTKIDIFSYGVVLLELISGKKVIDVDRSPASVVEWAIPLIDRSQWIKVCDEMVQLPRYMEDTVKQLLSLASRCVLPRENLRPSMDEIVDKLDNFVVVRFSSLMSNCLWDVILNMRRRKLCVTKCKATDKVTCSGADHNRESVRGDDSMSNGTLLVREILADITLK
ncbi:hypothetical protein RD792_015996 [Penstemon davidsonii]|uniref:Protein kinase domain-containing protein n=1 Tax=Penstemon davidsonii TaxID=160366 RepID=A0ABR0CI60_9LAMI|nr:hypothetical protein RD792_015996 [Penstemon davidsonii]